MVNNGYASIVAKNHTATVQLKNSHGKMEIGRLVWKTVIPTAQSVLSPPTSNAP